MEGFQAKAATRGLQVQCQGWRPPLAKATLHTLHTVVNLLIFACWSMLEMMRSPIPLQSGKLAGTSAVSSIFPIEVVPRPNPEAQGEALGRWANTAAWWIFVSGEKLIDTANSPSPKGPRHNSIWEGRGGGTQERHQTGGGATQIHRTREPHPEGQGRAQQTRRRGTARQERQPEQREQGTGMDRMVERAHGRQRQ